ncbi:transposable element Tcb1 transposase [Trichonephila clavipes]|uniref:Transposable element Tcb1 transposase n=1 Tax=Trichonephila clavipes TaxID=2585209 RepID=A0A8X6VKJ2_TRICX|nr:transposable element Tcb1 transposase [Trichonephila clavipes]
MTLMDRAATSQVLNQDWHQDGRIRVLRNRGERSLAACIPRNHSGPSPGVKIWGTIGYTSWLPIFRIAGTLNSAHYISGVLRPVVLAFIPAL